MKGEYLTMLRKFKLRVPEEDAEQFQQLMDKIIRGSTKDMVQDLVRIKKTLKKEDNSRVLTQKNIKKIQEIMKHVNVFQTTTRQKAQQSGQGGIAKYVEDALKENNVPEPYLKNLAGLDISHAWPTPSLKGYIVPAPDATKASLSIPVLSEQKGVGKKKATKASFGQKGQGNIKDAIDKKNAKYNVPEPFYKNVLGVNMGHAWPTTSLDGYIVPPADGSKTDTSLPFAMEQKGASSSRATTLPRRYFDANAPENYFTDVSSLETEYGLPTVDGKYARPPMEQSGMSSRATVLPRRYFNANAPEPYYASVPEQDYTQGNGEGMARLPMEQHGWGLMKLVSSSQGKSTPFVGEQDIRRVIDEMNTKLKSNPIQIQDEKAMYLVKKLINEKIRLLFLYYNALYNYQSMKRKTPKEIDMKKFKKLAKSWM